VRPRGRPRPERHRLSVTIFAPPGSTGVAVAAARMMRDLLDDTQGLAAYHRRPPSAEATLPAPTSVGFQCCRTAARRGSESACGSRIHPSVAARPLGSSIGSSSPASAARATSAQIRASRQSSLSMQTTCTLGPISSHGDVHRQICSTIHSRRSRASSLVPLYVPGFSLVRGLMLLQLRSAAAGYTARIRPRPERSTGSPRCASAATRSRAQCIATLDRAPTRRYRCRCS
jgi:hypothetical protein